MSRRVINNLIPAALLASATACWAQMTPGTATTIAVLLGVVGTMSYLYEAWGRLERC